MKKQKCKGGGGYLVSNKETKTTAYKSNDIKLNMLTFILLLAIVFGVCFGVTYSALTSTKTATGIITIEQPLTITFTGDTYGLNGVAERPSSVNVNEGDILMIEILQAYTIYMQFHLNGTELYRGFESDSSLIYYMDRCYINGEEWSGNDGIIGEIMINTSLVIECVWSATSSFN